MKNFIDKKVKNCPNCLGKSFQKVASSYFNVYSELISNDDLAITSVLKTLLVLIPSVK